MRLHTRRALGCALLFFFLAVTGFSAPAGGQGAGQTDYVSIPLLRGKQGQPLLDAQINGRDALLYLDTGAPLMCIDRTKVRRFDLNPILLENNTPVLINANGISHRVTTVSSLNLGPLKLENAPAVLIDFREINRALRSVRERTSDAILGLQVLQAMSAIVDFEHSQLLVKASSENSGSFGRRLRRAGWAEIPMHMNEGHLAVHARVNGARTRLVVDTGSPVSVLDRGFSSARDIALTRRMFASQGINFRDAAVQLGQVDLIRIGDYKLKNLTVAVFDLSRLLGSGGERSDPLPDGLLGCETLVQHRAYIDCDAMKLYLKAPR